MTKRLKKQKKKKEIGQKIILNTSWIIETEKKSSNSGDDD
jgi:hypothetical protein